MSKKERKPLAENHNFKDLQALIHDFIISGGNQSMEVADLVAAAEAFLDQTEYSQAEQRLFVVILTCAELIAMFSNPISPDLMLLAPIISFFLSRLLTAFTDLQYNRQSSWIHSYNTFFRYAEAFNFTADLDSFRREVARTVQLAREDRKTFMEQSKQNDVKLQRQQEVDALRTKLSSAVERLSSQEESATETEPQLMKEDGSTPHNKNSEILGA